MICLIDITQGTPHVDTSRGHIFVHPNLTEAYAYAEDTHRKHPQTFQRYYACEILGVYNGNGTPSESEDK